MFDEHYTNDKANDLIEVIGFMAGNRATDSELQQVSGIIEDTCRFIAEWIQTEEGKKEITDLAISHSEYFYALHELDGVPSSSVFVQANGSLFEPILNLIENKFPQLNMDLVRRAITAWREFLLSNDHCERLMQLSVE